MHLCILDNYFVEYKSDLIERPKWDQGFKYMEALQLILAYPELKPLYACLSPFIEKGNYNQLKADISIKRNICPDTSILCKAMAILSFCIMSHW